MFITEPNSYLYTKQTVRPLHTANRSYTVQYVTKKEKNKEKKLKLTRGPEIDLCVQPFDNDLYIE